MRNDIIEKLRETLPPLLTLRQYRAVKNCCEATVYLLRAGVDWWEIKSANAGMWALAQSGVVFRTIVHEDGTVECWQQPELAPWQIPRRDPSERRPSAPEVAERHRATMRTWRQRERERKAQQRERRERAAAHKAARDVICLEPGQNPDRDGRSQ